MLWGIISEPWPRVYFPYYKNPLISAKMPIDLFLKLKYIIFMSMDHRKDKKKKNIMKLLQSSSEPLSSIKITEELMQMGMDISERSVRIYLQEMDEEGLTQSCGKKGRILTDRGQEELESSDLIARVGYMSARIDRMTYKMTFDLEMRSNTIVIPVKTLKEKWHLVRQVFEKGYAMGALVSLLPEKTDFNGIYVPEAHVGLCTVCSVTLNGVLLKKGVPVRSIFSGLLELKEGKADHFSELINYDGTSLDPLELFIRGRMTNYPGAQK